MKRPRKLLVAAAAASLVACVVSAATAFVVSPGLHWRGVVILKKATGDLDEISWARLLAMLQPKSGFWLQPIANGRGLHATIANPHNRVADVAGGEVLFRTRCSGCHGEHSAEIGAPNLLTTPYFKHGDSDWSLFKVITDGVPQTAMVAATLQDKEVWQVIAYLRSSRGATYTDHDQGSASESSIRPVTYDRLRHARKELDGWLTYSGAYDGQRYSPLDEIDRSTIRSLSVAWVHQLSTEESILESTPLVADGVMYVTVSPDSDVALDATTGKLLWQRRRPLPTRLTNCCGPQNRGVAILGRTMYRGTPDGHLIARDMRTGELVWDVEVGAAAEGFSITAAPLAVENKIITGVAGADFGIRGYLDAYDADTGKRIWRLYTIPAKGEPGNDTWSGDSWVRGGGSTWMTGSYDPDLGLLYWGTGNPAPDFNGDDRQGDNLYTDSVLAVEAATGKLAWHFQFTPHDLHDWDAIQVPVLTDSIVKGVPRKVLLTANKNGFAYVLDRRTGEFLLAHEITGQTWADGIDSSGRPVRRAGTDPTPKGTEVRPGPGGGANWSPPSYNPRTGLVYYSVADTRAVFFKSEVQFKQGAQYLGSGGEAAPDEAMVAAVRAFKAGTGELAWEYLSQPRSDWPHIVGSLTTAGTLLFFGDHEYFLAVDAQTGEVLWRINLGAPIHAAPITYRSNGKQHVAVVAGRSVYSFARID